MGYNMRWLETPKGEKAATEAARALLRKATDQRDAIMKIHGKLTWNPDKPTDRSGAPESLVVDNALDVLRTAKRSYFHLNIGGMRVARKELCDVGLFVHLRDERQWPRGDYFDCTCDERDGDDRDCPLSVNGYHDQVATHLRWHPGDVVGIPTWKFSSNDGWHVTLAEITTTVAVLDQTRPGWRDEIVAQYVRWFVAWIEESTQYGGFRVS